MVTQIAVKLPDRLVRAVDALVADGRYPSRSSAVRAGLDLVLAQARDDAVEQAFAAGFARRPETDAELAEARRLAVEAIDDEPWEPWW